MKKIHCLFLFLLTLFSIDTFGQYNDGWEKKLRNRDGTEFADYLNSEYVGDLLLISSTKVDSLKLIPGPLKIKGKEYKKAIQTFSKLPVDSLLSLEEIKRKYVTGDTYKNLIYFLNGSFIVGDPSLIKIDKNYILKVNSFNSDVFESFQGKKDIKFTLVFIFTKTKENVKRSETIFIRGAGDE